MIAISAIRGDVEFELRDGMLDIRFTGVCQESDVETEVWISAFAVRGLADAVYAAMEMCLDRRQDVTGVLHQGEPE